MAAHNKRNCFTTLKKQWEYPFREKSSFKSCVL